MITFWPPPPPELPVGIGIITSSSSSSSFICLIEVTAIKSTENGEGGKGEENHQASKGGHFDCRSKYELCVSGKLKKLH